MTDLTTTGTTVNYEFSPSKKQILQRLFEAGHITFEEMWTLIEDNEGVKYIPTGQAGPAIIIPYQHPQYPWESPYTYTDAEDNDGLHNTTRGNGTPESH